MLVRFWGVRGSVPWSSPGAGGIGCNTACLEVRDEETNEVLILDAGTGIIGLGHVLAAQGGPVSLVLTHYHWDHVQGLPFFVPLFKPQGEVSIWAPVLKGGGPGAIEALFAAPHFPFPFDRLPAPPVVNPIEPGDIRIGRFDVQAVALNHPGGSYAYRVRGSKSDLVYISDHEFGNPEVDEALAPFALNSGATVLNAHFTPEELPSFRGWGHSSWLQSTEFASATGAGHLWLFHHKPGRCDKDIEEIEAKARRVYPATRAAREGDFFKL
ncbi:MAG TPA: MBL fold metallo-hydrolase [Vicinamibacterales bacterium]|nr:MBL fold metallo-hydrolase [Vicinamibacterales bacterium]